MLAEVRIRDLGVIEDAVLELHAGLNVLTGETGAGKTMVVEGLGLLFGDRADPGLVRGGDPTGDARPGGTSTDRVGDAGTPAGPGTGEERRTIVEGRMVLPPGSAALACAQEAGAELDGDVLLVGRSVSGQGRSRADLGGRAVPASVLAAVAETSVARHGQADQGRLTRPEVQLQLLDRFAGQQLGQVRERYVGLYRRWRAARAELGELAAATHERAREAERLRTGLAEVARVRPQPGEDVHLSAEIERLSHVETIRVAVRSAYAELAGQPDGVGDGAGEASALAGAADRLARAARTLQSAAAHDPALAGPAERCTELSYLVRDIATELSGVHDGLDADPARLARDQERLAALRALCRRYGPELTDVLEFSAAAAGRLEVLDADDGRRQELAAELARVGAELADAAAELSALRRSAATSLEARVNAELAGLAMPGARVQVSLTPRADPSARSLDPDAAAYGVDGADSVSFALQAHPSAPLRPLGRGASGGELSRIMLALEVVLAAADPVETMVFDEVDAGVGGAAAVELGRRLARLARSHQVLCVTHLPQVAAFADQHLCVVRDDAGLVTRSGVRVLDHEGRVRELARMLAGLAESTAAAAHAEELLAMAAHERGEAESDTRVRLPGPGRQRA